MNSVNFCIVEYNAFVHSAYTNKLDNTIKECKQLERACISHWQVDDTTLWIVPRCIKRIPIHNYLDYDNASYRDVYAILIEEANGSEYDCIQKIWKTMSKEEREEIIDTQCKHINHTRLCLNFKLTASQIRIDEMKARDSDHVSIDALVYFVTVKENLRKINERLDDWDSAIQIEVCPY